MKSVHDDGGTLLKDADKKMTKLKCKILPNELP